jgi:hyperosmotically inducible protein
MKANGVSFRVSTLLALPVLLIATTAVGQTDPKTTPKQEAKETAKKTGNVFTDSWITMKVHSQFIPEDALEGSDIDVETKNGVVSLKGTVRTDAGRDRAVAIAKATDGVKNVNSQLRIAPAEGIGETAAGRAKETTGTAGRAVTDGWIKSKIYSQYLTENALDDSDLDVEVNKGVVALNGTVRTDAGRTRAEAIAKETEGVKSVKNNLKVNPKAR